MVKVDVCLPDAIAGIADLNLRGEDGRAQLHVDPGMSLDELDHLDVIIQNGVDSSGRKIGELGIGGGVEFYLL